MLHVPTTEWACGRFLGVPGLPRKDIRVYMYVKEALPPENISELSFRLYLQWQHIARHQLVHPGTYLSADRSRESCWACAIGKSTPRHNKTYKSFECRLPWVQFIFAQWAVQSALLAFGTCIFHWNAHHHAQFYITIKLPIFYLTCNAFANVNIIGFLWHCQLRSLFWVSVY